MTTTAILIGGDHFVGHVGYPMSDKVRVQRSGIDTIKYHKNLYLKLNERMMEAIHI